MESRSLSLNEEVARVRSDRTGRHSGLCPCGLALRRQDDRVVGPGAVGVWAKADSVTAFDDFAYGGAM